MIFLVIVSINQENSVQLVSLFIHSKWNFYSFKKLFFPSQDSNLDVPMRPLEGQSSLVGLFIENVVFIPVDPNVHVNSIPEIISLSERLEAVDEPLEQWEGGKDSDEGVDGQWDNNWDMIMKGTVDYV